MKGRSESLVASALLHFVHSTSRGAALCYYLCYVFVWPHRPTAVLFLINATHSSYLSSVTTIILPTSLGSVPNAGKKNIIREVSSFHPGVSPLLRSAPLCYCDSLNNFLLLFCLSDPFDSLFFVDWCFIYSDHGVIDTIPGLFSIRNFFVSSFCFSNGLDLGCANFKGFLLNFAEVVYTNYFLGQDKYCSLYCSFYYSEQGKNNYRIKTYLSKSH